MKKVEDWTERAIEEAGNYISENDITDEDVKQDIYLLALEYAKIKNAGKFKYSFVKYLEKNTSREYLNRNNNFEKEYIDNSSYYMNYDEDEFVNNLLYVISTLTAREQKVLCFRFVDEMTLADVGKIFNVSRDRISQIEKKAIRKLRHPYRRKLIDGFDNIQCSNNDKFCLYFRDMINKNYTPSITKINKNKSEKQKPTVEKFVLYTADEIKAIKKKQEEEKLQREKENLLEQIKKEIIMNYSYSQNEYVIKVKYLLENYSKYFNHDSACEFVFKNNFRLYNTNRYRNITELPTMYYDYCTGVNLYEKYSNIDITTLFVIMSALYFMCNIEIPLVYKETSTCFKIINGFYTSYIVLEPLQITDSKIEYGVYTDDGIAIRNMTESQRNSILNYIANQM